MAGVPLLPGILPAAARVIVEIGFGANLNIDASNWALANQWIDVTTDVDQERGPVTITPMGRSDRFVQAQPAGCAFVLGANDSAINYTKGPASPNWPFVRPNTPVRVSVTLNGITIFTRFFGYIESWEPHDDPSGKVAWVKVTAWGKMHTLDLKNLPIRSSMTQAVLVASKTNSLHQYWSCEDGNYATQANSGLLGGVPMQLVFSGGLGPGMGQLDPTTLDPAWLQAGLPAYGTLALPQMGNGSGLTATFPASNASAWTVQFGVWQDFAEVTSDGNVRVLAEWTTPGGTFIRWRMVSDHSVGTNGTRVIAFRPDGTSVQLDATGQTAFRWCEYRIECRQSGGNIAVFFAFNGVTRSGSFTTATLAGVTGFTVNPDAYSSSRNFTVGHIRVWNQAGITDFQPGSPSPTNNLSAWYSHVGELTTDRLNRLCSEQGLGLPLLLTGSSNIAMGPQKPGKLVDLLRECEAADQGVLYDGVSQGLAYVARSAKYNQAASLTLNAAAAQIAPPFEPKDQDPQRRNLWVVGRRDGSSSTATDKTGPLGTDTIGTLDASKPDLNLATDQPLPDMAGWLLRLGTINEPYQYPVLNLDLSAIPSLASAWLSMAIGERIDITNLSTVSTRHPPGDVSLILEGYTEVIGPYEWTVQANCSWATPWNVAALNQTFRLEMVGQTLQSSLAPGATTLSLATAAGSQLFTTTSRFPADFPMDVNVAGWQVHVTAAADVLDDQFGRTVSAGSWGSADTGQSYTCSVPAACSVGSGVGKIQPNATGADFITYADIASTDFDIYCDVSVGTLPATNSWGIGICARVTDTNNFYALRFTSDTAGAMGMRLSKRVAGSQTFIVSPSLSTTYVAGTKYRLRFQGHGTALRGRIWLAANTEPGGWDIDTTDSSLTSGSGVGGFARNDTAVTTHVFSYDNLSVVNPQTLTVDAAPNTSTVPSGAAVTLWRPAALAL